MEIRKAVITAAGKNQRTLPLQTLVDRDGVQKTALAIIIEEILRAGVEEICVVVSPGDEEAYRSAAGKHAARLQFVGATRPLGYGHAIQCARQFTGSDPFLLLVGDHLYLTHHEKGCAEQLVERRQGRNPVPSLPCRRHTKANCRITERWADVWFPDGNGSTRLNK